MKAPAYAYFQLSTRDGFNCAVRHIKSTISILDVCENTGNVADKINQLLMEKQFDSAETSSAIHMLLVEKWNYVVISENLTAAPGKPSAIFDEISKWKAVDIVILYHHPDLGEIVVDPKNPAHTDFIADFRKNELVVVYAGFLGTEGSRKLAETACSKCIDLLENRKPSGTAELLKGKFAFHEEKKAAAPRRIKAAAPKASASRAKKTPAALGTAAAPVPVQAAPAPAQSQVASLKKITPMISVPVTNELFHNGNVEAWKRIIASYTAKYPTLQIFVYYDGERIIDINTLFKWGKVKHGSSIQFAVAGDNIQDVAKLKRYLSQGASPQFEAFLHGAPGATLKLF